ncbi:MAG: hypothetical protein AAGC93_16410 [Cyanobacteria bacterium P01_F01_bin.53]
MTQSPRPLTVPDRKRQRLTVSDRSSAFRPIAFDGGFGFAKIVYNNEFITTPALLAPVRNHLHDVPTSRQGGLVAYLDGPRQDLKETLWMTGFPAYQYFPQDHQRVVDTPDGKITYGLQMLLGCLATLPYQAFWNLNLVASIQDAEVMGARLAEALTGYHHVKFADNAPCTVNIRVLRVFEESFGVIAAHHKNLRNSRQTVVFDLGYGTTIVSLFAENGSLAGRTVINLGVGKLINAIATNALVRQALSQPGDPVLIREAIERGDFLYGTTEFSLKASYDAELGPWVAAVLAPAKKAASPWLVNADHILGIGGGSQLPLIYDLLKTQQINPVKNGAQAHANGLYLLAEAASTTRR